MKKIFCVLGLSLLASVVQGQGVNFSAAHLPGLNAAALRDMRVDIPAPVSDVATAGPRVTLLLNAAQADQAAPAWPGYSVLSQPILLYEAGLRSFLIGHPAPPAGYSQLFSSPQAVFMKPGPEAGINFTYYFDFPVNGVGTFVLRYESAREPAADVRTLVHERFHAYQRTAFKFVHSSRTSEPDAQDLALAALEQKILKSAITAERSSARALAARQFLAVRGARYERQPDSQGQEDMEERSEGTALYVDHVIMDRPEAAPSPGGIVKDIVFRLEWLPGVPEMNKSRYYGTGAAQALLLDLAALPEWKARVAAGSSLRAELGRAYPLSGGSAPLLLSEAKLKYDYRQLLKEAGDKLEAFQAAKAAAIAEYESAPGLEWYVPSPRSMGYSAQAPNYALGNSETLMPKLFLLDASAEGFSIIVKARPVIHGAGAIRFHSASPEVVLDGRPFSLAEGRYGFSALSVTDPGLTLSVSKPGTLEISGGKARITYR